MRKIFKNNSFLRKKKAVKDSVSADDFKRASVSEKKQMLHEAETTATQSKEKSGHFWGLVFFPLALLYHELLIQGFCFPEADIEHWIFILLSSVAGGSLLNFIFVKLPKNRDRVALGYIISLMWIIFVCVEYCLKSYFTTFFGVSYMITMTFSILSNFGQSIPGIATDALPFVLLSLIPLVFYGILQKNIFEAIDDRRRPRVLRLGLAMLFWAVVLIFGSRCSNADSFQWNFSANAGIEKFGITNDAMLETIYDIFGTPEQSLKNYSDSDTKLYMPQKYNMIDYDFEAMATQSEDSEVASLNRYFDCIIPDEKNEMTGLFEGKNLIQITAESFSYAMIDEKLTPALYQLTHEGFVFSDFYQPDWTQSTTGGEYAVMSGLVPTWIDGNVAFTAAIGNNFPFSLGKQLRDQGYTCNAYHNNTFSFYNRDQTHPSMSYDFYGEGASVSVDGEVDYYSGLTFSDSEWPHSDLEMFEQTIPGLIEDYVKNGQLFNAYYMTVSGHGDYLWSHAMVKKNIDAVVALYPDLPEEEQNYLAANLELEYALEYLLQALSDAGIAEDTVITLCPDHYPYVLASSGYIDYYNDFRGTYDTESDISRYANTLILWTGDMKKAVTVDTPCTSLDILPTLSNLFGLRYDSRLLSGKDVFATDVLPGVVSDSMRVAIIPTASGISWKTAAGTYDSSTDVFTPNSGVTVDEDYADQVNDLVITKYGVATKIIETDYYSTLVLPEMLDAKKEK